MAAARTMEARLVLAGEDRGASAAINKVVAAVRQMEDAGKVSKPLQEVAKTLQQVEQASRATDAALKARTGFTQAEAGLKATREAAAATARALDEARKARTAFDGVKAAKGSEQAQQIQAATRAVREAGEAHRKAEGDVRKATAAVSAQTATLGHAERAAAALGSDLKNLEGHQVKLRQVYDATTEAMVRQVRAEERASRVGATMGSVGRAQLERIEQTRRLTEGMSQQARAARELADQEARLVRIEHDRKRASAGRDLSAGMGSAGRRTLDDIEGGRRVASGMGASAREARAAAEASVAAAAARAKDQRAARDVAAGVAGVAASSALEGAYVKARDGWIEMDEASRRQKAVLGLTDAKQVPLNAQALKIGQDTRFSNPDVVKAQTRIGSSLPDHLKDPKVIAGITENAKDYALAMGTTMDEASSALLGRMLGLRMDMSTPEAATKSAKHATNRLVQFAKSSGADHHDLMGYTKFGAAPSSVGGFSEEFTDAMGVQLRRIGYEGAMVGNFVRGAATRLAVPTSKGLGALAAAGINHSDYVAPGNDLSSDNLNSALKLKFGKGLNNSQLARIQDLMNDEDVVGNKEEFVPRISAIVQETLAKRTKKGTINATDAERIAKSVDQYHSAAAGAVDIERLMRDVIAKGIKPALAKYLFGSEHGGRAQALDLGTLNKDVETFRKTPENRAQKIGEDINAGSYGAYQRMIGSFETFWMRLGQVNDGPLTKFYDGLGNAVDVVSRFPNGIIQAGTALGGLAGAAVAVRGAIGVFRIGRDLLGFGGGAAALSGSAAALTTSAGLLDAAAVKLAGGNLVPGPGGPASPASNAAKNSALGAAAAFGLPLAGAAAVAYVLSEYGDPSKSVNGTGGRPDDHLKMNPGDELPGLSGSADAPSWTGPAPSMIAVPRQQPLTLGGSGLGSFGLSGAMGPEAIAKRDADRYTRALVEARRDAPPLNPGDELPGIGDVKVSAPKAAEPAKAAPVAEGTDQRLIREHHEMLERQRTLSGQAEELTQRLETERGVHSRLKEARAHSVDVAGPLADSAARIARWEEEVTALDARIKALGSMPLPPPRPTDIVAPNVSPPSMSLLPEKQPLTRGGSGLDGFGLSGPMSPEEIGKRDANRYTRGFVDARRSAVTLNPGDELPGLGPDAASRAQEKGAEVGTKAGEGIRTGIETKAPEVEEQGRSLFQRLKNVFSQGILIPMSFAPGEGMGMGGAGSGGGLIQKASFGGGGSDSAVGSLNGGSGLVRHGGGGSPGGESGSALGTLGGGPSPGLVRRGGGVEGSGDFVTVNGHRYQPGAGSAEGKANVASWLSFFGKAVDDGGLGMAPDKARAMVAMMQGESSANLNPRAMGDYRGRTPTAFGAAQWRLGRAQNLRATAERMGLPWTDTRAQQAHMRAEMLGLYGRGGSYRGVYDAIQAAPSGEHALAIGIDRFENPAKKALAFRFRRPYLERLRRDSNRPTVPADEPQLVKGVDGKEGLDLGNGTMKMPDGTIRSIPRDAVPERAGLTIPERPEGGFGGGGRRDMGSAAERMHQAVDRMEGMGFDGQIQLAVTGPGRSQVRATGLKVRGRGGMSADMGMTMPGAKEDLGDWV